MQAPVILYNPGVVTLAARVSLRPSITRNLQGHYARIPENQVLLPLLTRKLPNGCTATRVRRHFCQ